MKLLEPLSIGAITLPNRVVLPAMVTRLSGEDGQVNADILNRYVRHARGGPGLIVIEAMAVHESKSGPLLRLSDGRFLAGHRELLRRMRDAGPSKVVPQIIHFLKMSRSGWRQKVTDVTRDEIREIVRRYGEAARRAQVVGYDGVELHMAHAYTLSSFLSMRNRRADEYGGSLENRLRLLSEVVARVRSEVGTRFPVGVRFDGEECIKEGYGLNDSREIALRLASLGVDYLSISAGGKFEDAIHKSGQPLYPYTGYSGDRCMPGATYQDGYNLYLSDGIRSYLRSKGFTTPVIATGKIRTPEHAESILRDGKADLVGLARAQLADPDWVRKLVEGRGDTIVRCISINVCKALDENFRRVRCTLWPRGALHAPVSADRTPPTWLGEDGSLEAHENPKGHVRLHWRPAQDPEGLYGYEIWRAVDDGPFAFLSAIRADMHSTFQDSSATAGCRLRYFVRAYDLAGNKSDPSNIAEISMALPEALP